ncbi:MAG: hypothetical protein CMJ26_03200 [Phycisphaerae bacterium]|nr:hypothetical protein [Phycisphaerae bacterium]
MTNKFILTAAGAATAFVATSASAELMQFHYDKYAGEAGWTISDSDGNMVASASVTTVSGDAYVSQALYYWSGSDSDAGYAFLVELDLAAGDYSITLTDTWADGWAWAPADGSDAFVYGDYSLAFTSGSSVTGSFTVPAAVPAPGALALLGLAGLAGRRRK